MEARDAGGQARRVTAEGGRCRAAGGAADQEARASLKHFCSPLNRPTLNVMRLRDNLPGFREAIAAAAAACGASDVRLFGSVVRGEDRDDSDVDFLVRLEPGRSLLDLVRFEARLEALL